MRAEFADRVAFVTGAGSGIGAAVAVHLAAEGARVAVADIDDLSADRTVHLIRQAGGHAEATAVDVSDPASVETAVTKSVASFGALHLVVNNAGVVGATAPTAEYNLKDWRRVIDINLSGVFYCLRYEIPALITAGGGSIVNISSVLGTNGCRQQAAYAAAKHGIVGLTKCAALEYADQGIRVNTVAPGYIDTPLLEDCTPLIRRSMIRAHPIGRLGLAAEVAEMVAFLLSERASFITGSCHLVDGGYSAY
ncbi:MAG: SDR family oxidoreductase [Pseudonocardiales bacterium]|nr:SDR family oxidoreductase [Pseudonocardiales bacterium]